MSKLRRILLANTLSHTLLNYLQSNGTQWLNTGILPTNGLKLETQFSIAQNLGTKNNCIYGGRIATNNGAVGLIDVTNSAAQRLRSDYGTAAVATGIQPVVGQIYKVLKSDNLCYVDDVLKITHPAQTFSTTYSIYLYATNTSGTVSNSTGSVAIYYHKVWNASNVLIQHLVPVLKSGVPCMYDKVTGNYFYNIGTGTFLYG